MADDNDDFFESVSAMAERMGLKGKERERYIHQHMTRSGYRAVPQYVLDEGDDDEDDDDDGFFGSGRRRPRERRDRAGGRPRRPRDDDDWYS